MIKYSAIFIGPILFCYLTSMSMERANNAIGCHRTPESSCVSTHRVEDDDQDQPVSDVNKKDPVAFFMILKAKWEKAFNKK